MVIDDIIVNKSSLLTECLGRIEEEYAGDFNNLLNRTRLDAILLNLQRACEISIDLAMHVVRVRNLGIPQNSRHAFELMLEAEFLDLELCTKMKNMVGFRNIAIHQYQALNLEIVKAVIEKHLVDFEEFVKRVKRL